MEIQSKVPYILLAVILAILLVLNLLLCIVIPFLLIVEIIIAICEYFTIRKIKEIKRQMLEKEKIENNLLRDGYKKIFDYLFIDENRKVLNIYGKDYGFSQIIDCELVENNSTINSTLGNTKGKIKNNGKIKSKTNTIAVSSDYCNELYMNITVDDFNNPNIKLDVRGKGMLNTTSNKYKDTMKKANEVLSMFKLIILKNNEKYVENGTVTKIEHRYIQEKSYEQRLEELSRLYKDGALTDYEYSIKKQELLEKIK